MRMADYYASHQPCVASEV